MKPNRKLVIGGGIVAAVLIVAIVAWATTRKPETPQYLTAPVTMGDVEDSVLATGSLQPFEVVNIGSQTSGEVTSVVVKPGDRVVAGQLVATIDPSWLQNRLQNAEQNLRGSVANRQSAATRVTFQESKLAREQQLKDRGVGVPANFESAENDLRSARSNLENSEANVRSAELNVDEAKANLDHANIRAPIAGVIAEITSPVGTTINTNREAPVIAKIAKMAKMTVRTQVSEADIIKIHPGQKVYFTILGDPNHRYYATLRSRELTPAGGVLDPNAGSGPKGAIYYNALFDVPNDDGVLLPAMTAEVHIVLGEAKNVMTIPSTALGPKGADGLYPVRVLNKDSSVSERRLKIGLNNNFTAEVRSTNLKVGEQVIIGEAGKPAAAGAEPSKPLFGAAAAPGQ
jgi:macrolide-specific efflux system membrane fusion protein